MTLDLRPSPSAGTWYLVDPNALAESVDTYMKRAAVPELPGKVVGVIAPHAGHAYSGPIAGMAFAPLMGAEFDLVAVVSPFHSYHDSPLLTTTHEAYETPLGTVPVDRKSLDLLDSEVKRLLGVGLRRIPRDSEHSLEIELPFLQRALARPFNLLPVMVRAQAPHVAKMLGAALANLLRGKKYLLVGSTDLSHFYPQATARLFDQVMLDQMEAFSPEGMFAAEFAGKGYACGLGSAAAVLWAAKELGANRVKVLGHATSGDVTGDYRSVVGYGAAAILKSKSK
jgi:AmmeMemoRadiSam system protein B